MRSSICCSPARYWNTFITEIGGSRFNFHLVRFQFGEIKHIVDQLQQGVAGIRDRSEVFFGFGFRDIAVAEKVGETDDRIQRRPDLVADAGDEKALGFVCRLGFLHRLYELIP